MVCAILEHSLVNGEDLQKTKVFVLPVEPSLFNWTNGCKFYCSRSQRVCMCRCLARAQFEVS
ncbi:unnamed protein product [Nesidiocoris tenuis]|uniref:Uncharacterized protein n=1 Tax=Nesidiocoris tenuis TaxID=355587 RepID=A0A6H5GVG3_9HEMI|nr:unnamed protein product [Nesidiocoris tenuis]